MIFAGIDYSLNGSAVSIFDDSFPISFKNTKIWFFSKIKKYNQQYDNITGLHIEYDSIMDRNIKTSNIILDILLTNKVQYVGLEGYSFASKVGRMFDIAEGCGSLKEKMFLSNIPVEIIPPTTIKKFYTGKGNSNKVKMIESFHSKHNIHLDHILGVSGKIDSSPVADIVDSYAILEYILQN